jgi:hypothetical protein
MSTRITANHQQIAMKKYSETVYINNKGFSFTNRIFLKKKGQRKQQQNCRANGDDEICAGNR